MRLRELGIVIAGGLRRHLGCERLSVRRAAHAAVRHAHDRHRQPGLLARTSPAASATSGRASSTTIRTRARASRPPLPTRSRSSWAIRPTRSSGSRDAVQQLLQAGAEELRLLPRAGLLQAASATRTPTCQRLLLRRQPGRRRLKGHADRQRHQHRRPEAHKLGAQIGTTSYDYIDPGLIKPDSEPQVYTTANDDADRPEERPDRRPRRRLPDRLLHRRRPAPDGLPSSGSSPVPAATDQFGLVLDKGSPLDRLRRPRAGDAPEQTARCRAPEQKWLSDAGRGARRCSKCRARPAGDRRSRILPAGGAGRYVAIALVSTVVVFTRASRWSSSTRRAGPRSRQSFFNCDEFRAAFPDVARHFLARTSSSSWSPRW